MKLDEIINEANLSYLNSLIGGANKKHTFDPLAYENARQASIEKKIEKLKIEEIERKLKLAKDSKNAEKTIKYAKRLQNIQKIKEQLKIAEAEKDANKIAELTQLLNTKLKWGETDETRKLAKSLDSSDLGGKKEKTGTGIEALKVINALKGRICSLMTNYVNLVSGVGLNGDKSATNETRVVKGKKNDFGDTPLKTVGVPSESTLQAHYNYLKKAVDQLAKYEKNPSTPKRYFNEHLNSSEGLLKAMEKIKPSELSFDPEDIETPFVTHSELVKTGPKVNDDPDDREKYAQIKPVRKDKNGNIISRVWNTKMAEKIGNKRFNAFVYEELQPYIHDFQKYRKDWEFVRTHFDKDKLKDLGGKDFYNAFVKEIQPDLNMDFVSNKVKDGLQKRLSNADSASKKNSQFKKMREQEKAIDNIATAKDALKQDDKKTADYSAKQGAGKIALRNALYSKEKTDDQKAKTGNQGWLEAHHIEKLNLSKIKKIINSWIDENKEPSAKNNTLIKFFGVMPGTQGQGGAGTLVFMPVNNPAKDQFEYEGLYAFKASKSLMNGDLNSNQMKYIENHAGKNSKDTWKTGVLNALKKYDLEGQPTVVTEEVKYFNY